MEEMINISKAELKELLIIAFQEGQYNSVDYYLPTNDGSRVKEEALVYVEIVLK